MAKFPDIFDYEQIKQSRENGILESLFSFPHRTRERKLLVITQ